MKIKGLKMADAVLLESGRTDIGKMRESASEAIKQAEDQYEEGSIPEEAYRYLVDKYLEAYLNRGRRAFE